MIDIEVAINTNNIPDIITYCEKEGLHISLPDHLFFELVNYGKSKGVNLFKVLAENTKDVTKIYGNFPLLFSACMLGDLQDIKYLIKKGYHIDPRCLGAICYNHKTDVYDMIKYLCKFNIDVNYPYFSIPRRTAVSILANDGVKRNYKSLKLLMKKGGDINSIPREFWHKFHKYVNYDTVEHTFIDVNNISIINNKKYLII